MTTTVDYPNTKRFFELYNADPAFRSEYRDHPEQTLQKHHLPLDQEFISTIFQATKGSEHASDTPYCVGWYAKTKLISDIIRQLLDEPIRNKHVHWWRQRQLNRIKALYPAQLFYILPHIPIAFELSQGCSGQCPFCCFAPPPLQRVFAYTPENQRLWRNILEISQAMIGPIVKYGLCYYATEPFDNPGYERFIQDFYAVTQWWPQLTTVRHLAEPARIRKYINMIRTGPALESGMVRFSIISLAMLRRVHAEYSPAELEYVDLVLNNPEAAYKYSPAGRARQLLACWREQGIDPAQKFYAPGPGSCLSGFVINLAERTIRLIAPCNPDDQHPHGYIEFDAVSFTDAHDYEIQMESLIERNMPEFPKNQANLKFNPVFAFKKQADGIAFSTPFLTRRFHGDEHFVTLCTLIQSGQYTWADIQKQFENPFLTEYYLKPKLTDLFEQGIIQENDAKRAMY